MIYSNFFFFFKKFKANIFSIQMLLYATEAVGDDVSWWMVGVSKFKDS